MIKRFFFLVRWDMISWVTGLLHYNAGQVITLFNVSWRRKFGGVRVTHKTRTMIPKVDIDSKVACTTLQVYVANWLEQRLKLLIYWFQVCRTTFRWSVVYTNFEVYVRSLRARGLRWCVGSLVARVVQSMCWVTNNVNEEVWRCFVCLFDFYVPLENFSLIWRRHKFSPILGTHGHSEGGNSACHTDCDTGQPFVMVISENPWHSHLLLSLWQWSCP